MKIEWYPGHMAKAKRQIAEVLPKIDVVIEVLDARLPLSSANPMLEKLRGGKPCIKVLNKSDLADTGITSSWVAYFNQLQGVRAIPVDARNRSAVSKIPALCRRLVPRRGVPGKTLRAMVVGIPNVGKSTLINTLAGKKIARVGDKPAITTCHQQIDLRNGIILSDTPGLLWPHLEDQNAAQRLAVSGAIGENAYDQVEAALSALGWLKEDYPELLGKRYKLPEISGEPLTLLEEIGRRRGCMVSGGEVDHRRAAEILLNELRGGKIGRISLEHPPGKP